MRDKWKPQVTQTGDIIAKVSGSAAISVVGVANGRTIPVIIVLPDKENKIDAIINAHCGISAGDCESQWGCTFDHNVILLFLEFKNPVEARVIIPLDIIEYGAIIDQIIHMQCLYLMTGELGMKLSQNLEKGKILLEIPSRDFANEWNKLYKKKYCKYLRKTYHISRETAEDIFEKIQEEFSCIKKLRMN